MSAPVTFVGRGRHQLACEVGYQGQLWRFILDLARYVFEIIKDGLGVVANEKRWKPAIADS